MSVQDSGPRPISVPVPVSTADIRPVVASRRAPTPPWLFAGGAVLAAVALFVVLDGGRRARTAPSTAPRAADVLQTAPDLPPLYIETGATPPVAPPSMTAPAATALPPRPMAPPYAPMGAPFQTPAFAPPPMPQAMPQAMPAYAPPAGFPPPAMPYPSQSQQTASAGSSSPALVIDNTSGGAGTGGAPPPGQAGAATMGAAEGPIRAARLTRLAATVPQGTLIPAVLETALDSTRPGHVRAIVSRDVTGFDGGQVLIPRGTRLFGEYEADLNPGQNRAFVQWTRLVRPDGVTIALASPAADVQGRAGIQGKVNSHFLARFGAAFLQSTLNFGMGLASRSLTGDNGVVVALPGAGQSSGAPTVGGSGQIRPTLRVDAGVRVTVFVARDLEFPPSETRR